MFSRMMRNLCMCAMIGAFTLATTATATAAPVQAHHATVAKHEVKTHKHKKARKHAKKHASKHAKKASHKHVKHAKHAKKH